MPQQQPQKFKCCECVPTLTFTKLELLNEHKLINHTNYPIYSSENIEHLSNIKKQASLFEKNSLSLAMIDSSAVNLTSNYNTNYTDDNSPKYDKSDQLDKNTESDKNFEEYSNNLAKAKCHKRLRTTILPEQLNFLHECYKKESNPSRKMLEEISKQVNLKKRVVQVSNWTVFH